MSEPGNAGTGAPTGKKRLNIGIIICLVILLYLAVTFCTYFFGKNTEIYEVVDGRSESSQSSQFTAIALRTETIVNSTESGYVNYFVGDAVPVHVGQQTVVIDKSGSLSGRLSSMAQDTVLLENSDLEKINESIYDFDSAFDRDNYSDTYYFKYKIESQILDLVNTNAFESISTLDTVDSQLKIMNSEISGIVLHSCDGFEDVTILDIEASHFRKANYSKQYFSSNDRVSEGSPIYKVVTDEDWQLVMQLTGNDNWDGRDYVNVEFLSDGLVTECAFETFTRAGNKYGVISLSKYLYRYISSRYLQIRLVEDSLSGLKIPKTAVGSEEFYLIPVDFLTTGGNSSREGFLKQVTLKDGTASVEFITPDIVKENDQYVYVSVDTLNAGDLIQMPESEVTYRVYATESLNVAYIYDGGEYYRRLVEIIGENSGYYIIDPDTSGGLRRYDQILRTIK